MAKLSNEAHKLDNPRTKVLLYIEMAQAYLLYGRIQKVEEYLLKAKELAGLKLELTGELLSNTYKINLNCYTCISDHKHYIYLFISIQQNI